MSRILQPNEANLPTPSARLIDLAWFWPLIRARWGAISVVIVFVLANLVVSPLFESPMIDDWSYAYSVKRLVEDHQFVILGWNATTLVSQILWGALFSLPFGFSFGALHLSTAALSLAGLLALYALGKELGLGEGKSALIALTVFVTPIYSGLTYTFMTDIPSTALSTVSLWLYIIATRKGGLRWWLLGSLVCTAAILSRQTGIFVAVGAALWLLRRDPRRFDNWKYAAACAGLPLLATSGFSVWLKYVNGVPEGFTYNMVQLGKMPMDIIVRNVLFLFPIGLLYLGLFCFPYLVGCLPAIRQLLGQKSLTWAGLSFVISAASAVFLFVWFGWPMPYLHFGAILHAGGIGPNDILGGRPVVLGYGEQWLLTALAVIGAAILLVVVFSRLRLATLFSPSPIGLVVLVTAVLVLWSLFGYLYLWEWYFYDRYFLPLLGPVLLLLAVATKELRLRRLSVIPVLMLFGLFSMAGTHDWIAYRESAWSAAQSLVHQGVPLKAIDGGFEWDGWQLYEYSQAHPEAWDHADASPFWVGRRVAPVITSEYVVSFSPLDGYSVLRTVPYSGWLSRGSDFIYVLIMEPKHE